MSGRRRCAGRSRRRRRRPSSASGITSTPAARVWMRPCDSVTGTRWTRCTPPSNFSRAYGASPGSRRAACLHRDGHVLVAAEVGLGSASRTSVFQPRRSAYRVYIRSRSPANSADSSPPSPALISRMASLSSSGSRGTSSAAQPLLGGRALLGERLGLRRRTWGPRRRARGRPRGRRSTALPLAVGRRRPRSARRTAGRAAGPARGSACSARVGQLPLELGVLGDERARRRPRTRAHLLLAGRGSRRRTERREPRDGAGPRRTVRGGPAPSRTLLLGAAFLA